MNDLEKLCQRADTLLSRIEGLLPARSATDWGNSVAFRWRKGAGVGKFIQPVIHPHMIKLDDLQGIDEQKKLADRNTRQFVSGHPANNVLLTGARGTGKSSLVKALLGKYARKGLRVIEVEKHDLVDLPDIVEQIYQRPERFILYCDDLSFEADDPGYKALKVVLDGSVAMAPDNVLVYATSNRRHLMPEYLQDNLAARHDNGEIHPDESVEEKISLSDRFGLWLSFYPFDQDQYLHIVYGWLKHFGISEITPSITADALRWALGRGSRSGRIAWQFARDYAGAHRTDAERKPRKTGAGRAS